MRQLSKTLSAQIDRAYQEQALRIAAQANCRRLEQALSRATATADLIQKIRRMHESQRGPMYQISHQLCAMELERFRGNGRGDELIEYLVRRAVERMLKGEIE